MNPYSEYANCLVQRLRKRAEIRRSIPRGEPDRISDILEEAAAAIVELDKTLDDAARLLKRNADEP